jgi:hypothetical protein
VGTRQEEEYLEEGKEEFTPAKRRKTPPSTPIPSTPSTPMPGSAKRKTVSIKEPNGEELMSMKDLNESTARLGLNNEVMNVGQLSVPILRSAWQKKVRKEDDFNLIRILPHSSVALKQCDLTAFKLMRR